MPKFSIPVALSAFVFAFAFVSTAHGAAFLVGAQLYHSDNTGADIECCYQFSTNTGTDGHSFFPLDQIGDVPDAGVVDKDIAFELGAGANTFTFSNPEFSRPIYGLNLFFSNTATPLVVPPDRDSADPNGVPGDLTVFTEADTVGFSVPAAGTDVGSYGADNVPFPADRDPTSYSGDTEVVVGGLLLTVSNFSASNDSQGAIEAAFTITAREVNGPPDPPGDDIPAPGMLLLFGAAIAGLGFVRRRIV